MNKGKMKEFLRDSWVTLRLPLTAIALGLIVGAIIMIFVGIHDGLPFTQVLLLPLRGYGALFNSTFGSLYGFGEALVYVVPLILTGLSISFAFRCGLFNIGADIGT